MSLPCIVREEVVWEGKWIRSKLVYYKDQEGIERCWEAYERTNIGKSEVGGK